MLLQFSPSSRTYKRIRTRQIFWNAIVADTKAKGAEIAEGSIEIGPITIPKIIDMIFSTKKKTTPALPRAAKIKQLWKNWEYVKPMNAVIRIVGLHFVNMKNPYVKLTKAPEHIISKVVTIILAHNHELYRRPMLFVNANIYPSLGSRVWIINEIPAIGATFIANPLSWPTVLYIKPPALVVYWYVGMILSWYWGIWSWVFSDIMF